MGRLIPAGTGLDYYRNVYLESDALADLALEDSDEVTAEAAEGVSQAKPEWLGT